MRTITVTIPQYNTTRNSHGEQFHLEDKSISNQSRHLPLLNGVQK